MTDGQSSTRIENVIVSTPRRQPAEVRKEQILDAAEAIMLSRGTQDATVSEIAEMAGLGKGTVYLQFDSKQELIAGLRQRYVANIEEHVRHESARVGASAQKLSAFVRSFASATTRHPELHHLLFQDGGGDEADAFAPLRGVFADLVRAGGFQTPNLDLAIDYTFSGIHGAIVAVAHMTPAKRRRAISEIVDLVNRTLVPTDALRDG
jgi:TetR/AcrR family transcriptional regulator, transcriptional repressor for nem operon